MRLFSFLAVQCLSIVSVNGWLMSEKLPADISKSYFQSMQLRVDQMFRDTIAEHRKNVPDTDLRNPGHMEASFRRNITEYLENLIGAELDEENQFTTTARFKVKVSKFEPKVKSTSAAIIFGHGGGYVSGSVKLYSHFLQWLADETGATVFGPQYRLAPRRMWPGQFDEIMELIVHVYDNAEELGINKDKIIIAGDGTGATSTYAAALQLASNGRKVGEEYQRIAIYGAALLQPQTQCINFDSPSYRKFNHLTLRKADIGYSMSALFGGERDYDLIEAVEDGHVIDDTLQNSLEVKAVNPMIHLSKETLGDFEPDSLVYEPTEHQWEKKLKNRITNGSVSPLAVMDRMLKAIPRVFLALNEKDILHDEGEMLFNKLNAISGIQADKIVESGAMHNNFAWSSYFTNVELLTLGNSQCQAYANGIKKLISRDVRDEL